MTDRIIRPAEAEHKTGYCNVHLHRLEEAGILPRRFKLNPDGGKYGAVGWMESWIDTYNNLMASGATADDLRDWVRKIKAARGKRPLVEE